MGWSAAIEDYINFLKLEKSLSKNSVAAYHTDMMKLYGYAEIIGVEPESVT